eukprot:505339-Prorocentrum_lima.AAC.1
MIGNNLRQLLLKSTARQMQQLHGPLHVDLTGPFEIQGEEGHRYLLIMPHRVQRGSQTMLIPS